MKDEYLVQIDVLQLLTFELLPSIEFPHFSCLECLDRKCRHFHLCKPQRHHASNIPRYAYTFRFIKLIMILRRKKFTAPVLRLDMQAHNAMRRQPTSIRNSQAGRVKDYGVFKMSCLMGSSYGAPF